MHVERRSHQSMRILDNGDIWTDGFRNCIPHIGVVRAWVTDRVASGDARGECDCLRAPLDHFLGSRNRTFARASAAAYEPYNFDRAGFFKRELALRCDFEIRRPRADVFRLLATDNSDLFHAAQRATSPN